MPETHNNCSQAVFSSLLFTSLKGLLIENQLTVRVVGKGAIVLNVDSKEREAVSRENGSKAPKSGSS